MQLIDTGASAFADATKSTVFVAHAAAPTGRAISNQNALKGAEYA
jgi:hypothetical protein